MQMNKLGNLIECDKDVTRSNDFYQNGIYTYKWQQYDGYFSIRYHEGRPSDKR